MQLADPNLTTPIPYTPPHLPEESVSHRIRVLVDEAATTRGLTLQMSLRAMAYCAAPDDAQRIALAQEFDAMRAHFHRNLELVFGTATLKDQNADDLALLRKGALRDPQRAKQMARLAKVVDAMAQNMSAGNTVDYDQATTFMADVWPVARDQMTQVIWDVWAEIESNQGQHLSNATRAADALSSRLTRLEHIGKHVRLVSLNASVEAARAGEVGKGLMVIAQEFKTLAEEIQTLAKGARDDVSDDA